MSLVVTCPNCGTVFSMVREQLEASEGRVRCGHCMEVFDAKVQLTQMEDLDREHKQGQGYVDSVAFDQTQPSPSDLSFVQEAKKQAFWSSPGIKFLLAIFALCLFLLLAVQLLRTERIRILKHVPSATNLVMQLCTMWPCTALAQKQIDGWLIENSNFQKDGVNNFKLSATLKNISNSALVVPQVELQLLDNSDALLVRHVIATNDNEPIELQGGAEHAYQWLVFPQNSTTSSVKINTKELMGYRLVLFYP